MLNLVMSDQANLLKSTARSKSNCSLLGFQKLQNRVRRPSEDLRGRDGSVGVGACCAAVVSSLKASSPPVLSLFLPSPPRFA